MIKSKADLNSLCMKNFENLTVSESRLLLFNYIYHRTGKQVQEVLNLPIINQENFAFKTLVAYNYYLNI